MSAKYNRNLSVFLYAQLSFLVKINRFCYPTQWCVMTIKCFHDSFAIFKDIGYKQKNPKCFSRKSQLLFSLPLHINSVWRSCREKKVHISSFGNTLAKKKIVFHAKYDVGRAADGVERCSRQGRTVHIYYSIWVLLNNKRVSHDDLKWVLWHEASRCRKRQGTGHPSTLFLSRAELSFSPSGGFLFFYYYYSF